MQVVVIYSQPYDSYASIAQADEYAAAAFHASSWISASTTTKGQALVTATRVLDRQRWASDYETQAAREGVQGIADACVEMAIALVDGSELQSEQSTAQKLQSISAGSVSLSYFRGAEGHPHRFPLIVHELLRSYLAGADLSIGMTATGTDGTSSTEDDFGHTEGL